MLWGRSHVEEALCAAGPGGGRRLRIRRVPRAGADADREAAHVLAEHARRARRLTVVLVWRISRRQVMESMAPFLKVFLTTLLYTVFGVVVFGIAFAAMVKISPFSIRKEL